LTACGNASQDPILPPKIELVIPEIPDSLLVCMGSPRVPGEGATQADVARFIVRLHAAYRDCEGNLAAVKRIIDELEGKYEAAIQEL